MYFTGGDDYYKFLVFFPILSSIILNSNKKVSNWISTETSSEIIKPFGKNLEPAISNLSNGRVNLNLISPGFLQVVFVLGGVNLTPLSLHISIRSNLSSI